MTLDQPKPNLHLTKSGLPKSRYSLQEKLQILDQDTPAEVTLTRVKDFQNLFAFRFTEAIITKKGQGPRAWTKLRGRLTTQHIIRHLLADRIATQPPRWVGARSLATSLFFCIDVDADRTKEQLLADNNDVSQMEDDIREWMLNRIETPSQPTFPERCKLVESALRRLGINPCNPRHVLVQATPRGGRHYYVFLDAPYHLSQTHDLLKAAGLVHKSGQIELYPSEQQGLRLPFGHLPDTPRDPTAWVQFIDDYRNGRIGRFSLTELYEHLGKHKAHHAKINAARQARPAKTQKVSVNHFNVQPLRQHQPLSLSDADMRYEQILSKGITSFAEALELQHLGIRQEGTRTKVLNLLANHLIWHKHHTAEEATEILTNWAMNSRHTSKDIKYDLSHGTNKVANQISAICDWYTQHEHTSNRSTTTFNQARFGIEELTALERSLASLSNEACHFQAEFFLRFLSFAKRYGEPAHDQTGWEAAPAINQVIRRWRGCHHMNYKDRIDHAITSGTLTLIQNSWHSKHGKGRARTYRLIVPVIPPEAATLDYESALKYLSCPKGIVEPAQVSTEQDQSKQTPPTQELEHAQQEDPSDFNKCTINNGTDTSNLLSSHPGVGLEPSPRECDPQSDAASGVRRHDLITIRTNIPRQLPTPRGVTSLTILHRWSRPTHSQKSTSLDSYLASMESEGSKSPMQFPNLLAVSQGPVVSTCRSPPSDTRLSSQYH